MVDSTAGMGSAPGGWPQGEDSPGQTAYAEVPIAQIRPNPRNPRQHFDPERIAELAASIAAQGVIQPLAVRPHPTQPGHYELIAGERRLRALQQLGTALVPVVVRNVPDTELLEAALVENLQREALTPIEEALAYRALMQQHGHTQEQLATRVGRQRSTIANMMRLLGLPMAVQEDLESGRLSIGHARALLAAPLPDQQLALREIVLRRNLSVRETEALVKKEARRTAKDAARPGTRGPGLPPGARPLGHEPAIPGPSWDVAREAFAYKAAQDQLERALGTRVLIHRDRPARGEDETTAGGRLEISFYSVDDFNRLYKLLMDGGE